MKDWELEAEISQINRKLSRLRDDVERVRVTASDKGHFFIILILLYLAVK